MGKVLRIRDDRFARAVDEGAEFLLIGRRRFRLVEVGAEDPAGEQFYEPIDLDEVKLLEEAMNDDSPLLTAEEGRKYLLDRLKEHGIG